MCSSSPHSSPRPSKIQTAPLSNINYTPLSASDLINRLSLSFSASSSPKEHHIMEAPASDPTHLCPRHRRIIEERKREKKGEEKAPLKGTIEAASDELSKVEKKKVPVRDTSPVFRSAPLPRPIFETPRVR